MTWIAAGRLRPAFAVAASPPGRPMPSIESQVDASFYRLIHELAVSAAEETRQEQSAHPRESFDTIQRIAPGHAHRVPPPSAFREVRCHDLTQSGFSFLLPERPTFDSLVAAFGRPPREIFVAAEVLRCRDVLLYPTGRIEHVVEPGEPRSGTRQGETGVCMVLVSCRFTRRLRNG